MSEINNTPESINEGVPEVNFTLQVAETIPSPVDDTLSISGMAADAKATGEAIDAAKSDLQEEIDTAESDLQDKIDTAKSDLQDEIDTAKTDLQEEIDALDDEIDSIHDDISAVAGTLFPVGSIYVSTSSTAPTFGGENWNWQEIMFPATWGDVQNGSRSYVAKSENDVPGNVHFWLRIADTEVTT